METVELKLTLDSEVALAMYRVESFVNERYQHIREELAEDWYYTQKYFRIGKVSTFPKRTFVTRQDVYDFLSTVQGLTNFHIYARTNAVVIKAQMEKELRRSPIFQQEILFEIKQQIERNRPIGLHFKVIVK
jgi:tellurite resistance-related uncharacterized protein